MKIFLIEKSETEDYTTSSGLALIGQLINRYSELNQLMSTLPLRLGISHADVAKGYLGVLCQGKNDFEAITQHKGDAFFKSALGMKQIPSCVTLRQRLDARAVAMMPLVDESNFRFLKNAKVPVTALKTGHVSIDMDVFPMDQSGSKKEGIEMTYKGHFGYAPMGAYLGEEGWNLACELRKGAHHSQNGFLDVAKRVVSQAKELTNKPLLMRLDSGHDALENLAWLTDEGVDFVIKWNPRKHDWCDWAKIADDKGCWEEIRDGKEQAAFRIIKERKFKGQTYPLQLIVCVTKRTMEANGQMLGFTEGLVEGWWTSLDLSDEEVIGLYKNHATSEQFHSEFKTDLDLERLPSGKFATNDLILSFASLC